MRFKRTSFTLGIKLPMKRVIKFLKIELSLFVAGSKYFMTKNFSSNVVQISTNGLPFQIHTVFNRHLNEKRVLSWKNLLNVSFKYFKRLFCWLAIFQTKWIDLSFIKEMKHFLCVSSIPFANIQKRKSKRRRRTLKL